MGTTNLFSQNFWDSFATKWLLIESVFAQEIDQLANPGPCGAVPRGWPPICLGELQRGGPRRGYAGGREHADDGGALIGLAVWNDARVAMSWIIATAALILAKAGTTPRSRSPPDDICARWRSVRTTGPLALQRLGESRPTSDRRRI